MGCVAQGRLFLIDLNTGRETVLKADGVVFDLLWESSGNELYYLVLNTNKYVLDCVAINLHDMTRETLFSHRVDLKIANDMGDEIQLGDCWLFTNDVGRIVFALEYRYPVEYWSAYGVTTLYYSFEDGGLNECHYPTETAPNKYNPYKPLVTKDFLHPLQYFNRMGVAAQLSEKLGLIQQSSCVGGVFLHLTDGQFFFNMVQSFVETAI